jgi:hypothetical protein
MGTTIFENGYFAVFRAVQDQRFVQDNALVDVADP